MTNVQSASAGRHFIALALTAPTTTAIAVVIVLPFLVVISGELSNAPMLAMMMFICGSLVGYCVEILMFLPFYAVIHRRMAATGLSVTATGAIAGGLPALILNSGNTRAYHDPIEFVLSPVGLAALGALGGAIYWLFLRETSPERVPFSGLSGSQP